MSSRPASTDALGDYDATGVAARIRAGDITAEEAVEAAIARIERVNPQLNFIATPLYDSARARARQPLSGPFAGAPTLIKDLLPLTGAPTKFGSRAFASYVSPNQPPIADAILASGVVPVGKSTTPEFGFTATTEPILGGPTLNPWNTAHSSGGSSGGTAAAVASGAVPIAHASDGGGSIRIPASCCGLFGLKPSRDRTVLGLPEQSLPISVNGCLSRSVRDTAAWIAATERTDSTAAYPRIGVVAGPSERRLRIGLAMNDLNGRAPHPDVATAIHATAEACRALGHTVFEFTPPIDGGAFELAFLTRWAFEANNMQTLVAQLAPHVPIDQLLEPLTLQLATQYRAAPTGALDAAVAHLNAVGAQYDAMFANMDLMLTPVLAKPPPLIGELAPTLPMDVGFARVREYAVYTPLENAAGAPAMSVPLGWSSQGLPIGSHFAAPKGEERRLLELAYELELAHPWAAKHPPIWAGG
ncbi:MAG: amidase [Pseudomonadota bacterium]